MGLPWYLFNMRFMSACPTQAELPLSSPHDADGLATKGEGAYKYQVTLARLLLATNLCGPAIRMTVQRIDPTPSHSKASAVSGPCGCEQCFSCPQIDPGSPRRAPKTLEVKSGGSRAASLVGFLKSREGQLGILSMVMLIFQGTALSLTLRFSRYANLHCPMSLLCRRQFLLGNIIGLLSHSSSAGLTGS